MKITKTVCDNCGAELHDTTDSYCKVIVVTKTRYFMDAAGSKDYEQGKVNFEFCFSCVKDRLIPALEKLAEKRAV